jgi:hypothetical protein
LWHAAAILPVVMGTAMPVGCGDVHAALLEALRRLGIGRDRYHRLRLADEARDMFAAYLVAVGGAEPGRPSDTVRGWMAFQDTTAVVLVLVDAAVFWRGELSACPAPARVGWRR